MLAGLVHAAGPRTVPELATALGWPLDRVRASLHDAERRADIAGPVTVHRTGDTYVVTASTLHLSAAQRAALG